MKEQWKKLDSDAKLFVDVEEGNQLPIKINIPLSALTPPRDEFCCNRLLTVLRVCVLLTLLTLLGWTVTTIYCNYYNKTIPFEEDNLENKFDFQSLVYKNKDAFEEDDQFKKSGSENDIFRESTKKALDHIAAEMKGFNEKLDQMQVEKEQQQTEIKTVLDDTKPVDDEVVTAERSDQTLDSMFVELAKEVGLAENQPSEKVFIEPKPELGAIIITEPQDEQLTDLDKEFEKTKMDLSSLLERINIEQSMAARIRANIDESPEESAYQSKFYGHFSFQPLKIENELWRENINSEDQLDAMLDGIAAETAPTANVDESREKDKEVDQVIEAMTNSMETSNLDNDSEKQTEIEDKVEVEAMNEQNENVEEGFIDGLVTGFLDTLFGDSVEEDAQKDDLSEHSSNENVEESPNEDRVEKEMTEQREQDEMVRQLISESLVDMVIDEMIEDEMNIEDKPTEDGPSLFDELINIMVNGDEGKEEQPTVISEEKHEDIPYYAMSGETVINPQQPNLIEIAPEDETSPSLLDGTFNFIANDDENKEKNPTTISEEKNEKIPLPDSYDSYTPVLMNHPDPRFSNMFSEETTSDFHSSFLPKIDSQEPSIFWGNEEMNINKQTPIQEDSSTKKTFVEIVPSVEYVKKIEENPFIPRVAKMLEPIVGQNHELLIWYYTHKNLPDFLRGADKWKVFGAKLLYDSNIKDYPADATIISGLTFEKVYGGAEYPSSTEEVKSELQQEIVNRLILKSYLNKMLLEGNADAETLSQVIEQHNLEKLKELDIDPQQLTYMGDFFEVDNKERDDIIIPVVQFDPFVDESREANEQRAQVIKAFEKARNLKDDKLSNGFFDSITSVASEPVEQFDPSLIIRSAEIKGNSQDSRQTSEFVTSEAFPETSEGFLSKSDDDYGTSDESQDTSYDWLTEFLPKDETIRFRRSVDAKQNKKLTKPEKYDEDVSSSKTAEISGKSTPVATEEADRSVFEGNDYPGCENSWSDPCYRKK